MLAYNINIQGNSNGEVYYCVTFQGGEPTKPEKFNSAQTASIYSTVDLLVDALKTIYPDHY